MNKNIYFGNIEIGKFGMPLIMDTKTEVARAVHPKNFKKHFKNGTEAREYMEKNSVKEYHPIFVYNELIGFELDKFKDGEDND